MNLYMQQLMPTMEQNQKQEEPSGTAPAPKGLVAKIRKESAQVRVTSQSSQESDDRVDRLTQIFTVPEVQLESIDPETHFNSNQDLEAKYQELKNHYESQQRAFKNA
jgi:hypothetical protein